MHTQILPSPSESNLSYLIQQKLSGRKKYGQGKIPHKEEKYVWVAKQVRQVFFSVLEKFQFYPDMSSSINVFLIS